MLSRPGLYLHLPWCVKKCPYCDFNSPPLKADTSFTTYVDALSRDLATQLEQQPHNTRFATVFIGGGTPSLCPPELLADLLAQIPLEADAEITLEANPGTAEYFDWTDFRNAGINRLSLGAQSFNADALRQLGRIHSPDETANAYAAARASGFDNINLDLMWGLPGQTVDTALADLQQAIDLQPEHISWYQLTIEAKTEFARRPPTLPVEDVLVDVEAAGLDLLADASYVRYEVSAYARDPARVCQHNINYWQFGDYLGIGAGAHGKCTSASMDVIRTQQVGSPRAYQQDPLSPRHTPVAVDAQPGEFMLNALRLVEGVPQSMLTERTCVAWREIESIWQRLVSLGLVQPDVCATTPLGLKYLDSVVAEFI